ncbi:MAG: sodium:proton antiporter [Sphingomonadales bacterium 32-68-7]|nr:MAG: sodium:proton antiporter [Sphingomonadales bacterium 12-68-11]OYX10528.1 MAG: sodium:proton antiporter [Sphingomonadales bacterium 32-68-7]
MYGVEPYHVLLAAAGASIILASWFPRFLSGREPATSALLIVLGLCTFAFVPGMPAVLDPVEAPRGWELASEMCLIVGLFGTGLRIDRLVGKAAREPTIRLLAIVMPLTIVAVAVVGWAFAGLTLVGALLLGAILAPTDPVLAGDVQVGRPQEGGEHPVRYALTTEAGLNDGLAFPFVHLGILAVAAGGLTVWDTGEWLLRDVAYRVTVGALIGLGAGWGLGKVLFAWPKQNALSETGSGVVALAGVLFAYGSAELLEGYGFIAAFTAGVTLRRSESEHEFHRRLHDFTEALEHALTALILLAIGAAIPVLWPHFTAANALIGIALVFVIRPVLGWFALAGTILRGRERVVVAFYGIRGIGSVYYLAYAGHHLELVNEYELWATVAFTILLSALVHGLTAGISVERATGEAEQRPA